MAIQQRPLIRRIATSFYHGTKRTHLTLPCAPIVLKLPYYSWFMEYGSKKSQKRTFAGIIEFGVHIIKQMSQFSKTTRTWNSSILKFFNKKWQMPQEYFSEKHIFSIACFGYLNINTTQTTDVVYQLLSFFKILHGYIIAATVCLLFPTEFYDSAAPQFLRSQYIFIFYKSVFKSYVDRNVCFINSVELLKSNFFSLTRTCFTLNMDHTLIFYYWYTIYDKAKKP